MAKCAAGRICATDDVDAGLVGAHLGQAQLRARAVSRRVHDRPCTDGLASPGETDVDCGGACSRKCTSGKVCQAPADCLSSTCNSNRCGTDPTCSDGIKNQDEVGLDCGGASCAPCPIGQPCTGPKDCASWFCTGAPKKCSTGFGARIDVAATSSAIFSVGRVNGDAYDDLVLLGGTAAGYIAGHLDGGLDRAQLLAEHRVLFRRRRRVDRPHRRRHRRHRGARCR